MSDNHLKSSYGSLGANEYKQTKSVRPFDPDEDEESLKSMSDYEIDLDLQLDLTDSAYDVDLTKFYKYSDSESDDTPRKIVEVDDSHNFIDLRASRVTAELPDYESPTEDCDSPLVISDDSDTDFVIKDTKNSDRFTKIEKDYVETDFKIKKTENSDRFTKIEKDYVETDFVIKKTENSDRFTKIEKDYVEPDFVIKKTENSDRFTKIEKDYVETDKFKDALRKQKMKRMKPYAIKLSYTKERGKQLVSGKSTVKSSTPSRDSNKFESLAMIYPSDHHQDVYSDHDMSIDEGVGSWQPALSMFCEGCESEQSHNSVVQCCDGHILCAQCVEKSTKLVLIGEKKGSVDCPKHLCTSTIPDSELRKSLPSIVLDLLEEKWKKETMEALDNMKDVAKCPSCGFSAVLDVGIKKFPCSNCCKAFCRCCDKRWEEKYNHDLCYRTKQWTSMYNGNVLQIPDHWSYNAGTEIQTVVEVENQSEEFFHVVHLIMQNMSVDVSKVYRIQNVRLWEKYTLTKSHMIDDLGEFGINEQRLFHGTNCDVVEAICKEGFDWRLCGKHGIVYGQGSYFAKSATMSHTYSSGHARRSRHGKHGRDHKQQSGFGFGAPNSNVASLMWGPGVHSPSSTLSFGSASSSPKSEYVGGLRFGAPISNSNSGLFGHSPTPQQTGHTFGASNTTDSGYSGGLRFGAPISKTDVGKFGPGIPCPTFSLSSPNSNTISGNITHNSGVQNVTGFNVSPLSTSSNTGKLQFGATVSTGSTFQQSTGDSNGNQNSVGQVNFKVQEGEYLVFLARVLAGRSCLGKSSMRRPERSDNGEITHSAVNDGNNPTIYVIFDSSQCYPEYLIQYK